MPRFNGYATFSEDQRYRYELGGDIGDVEPLLVSVRVLKIILWIMLNPSKATAEIDDQTIGTIIRFSERWGYNHLMVGNLYAYCATRPKDMWAAKKAGIDIVGPGNNLHLRSMTQKVRASVGRVMVAWGAGAKPDRVREVANLLGEVYCLRTNDDGSPVHPLYQPGNLVPVIWEGHRPA